MDDDVVARTHPLTDARRCAVDEHVPLFDPALQTTAAVLGQQLRQDLVKPV